MIFACFPVLFFAPLWDQIWKPFWLVLECIVRASGGKQFNKMSSQIDAKVDIGDLGSEDVRVRKRFPGWWPEGGGYGGR